MRYLPITAVFLTTTISAQINPDSTWPMFCHDLLHTSLSPLSGNIDTCYLLWSYTTNGQIFSSPALGDIDGNGDTEVVIGSDDMNVYAFNGEDGSVLWSYPVGNNEYCSPSLGDVDHNGDIEVVIGSRNDTVYALNGEDGSMLWLFPTGEMVRGSAALADIDNDDTLEVVFGSWDHHVYALNGEDGSLLWSYPTGNGVRSSPAVGDIDGDSLPEVVIGSWDSNIYALNGEDGSLLWSYPTGEGVRSSAVIGDINIDGNPEVVIGSEDNNVYALNGENGSYLWSYPTGNNVRATPSLGDIDGDDSLEVIIGSLDNNVYALNGENGSLLWSYSTNFGIWSSASLGDIDGDGVLEVVVGSGTSDNNVYALNGEDGSYLWSYTTGDGIAASPALGDVDGDGDLEIVIGSEDNSVYVLSNERIPPIPFNLISPPDSALISIPRPTFVWESSFDSLSGLSHYRIYIDDTLRGNTVDTTWIADYDLSEGYNTWYVYAVDSTGNSRQSNQVWVVLIDTSGPCIESTTVWVNTTFTGPFPIDTKVTDTVVVDSVILFYERPEDTGWVAASMSQSGGNWYNEEIPQVSLPNDTVKYYIFATNLLGHSSTDPYGAPTTYYSFFVYTTGMEEITQENGSFVFRVRSNPTRDPVIFETSIPLDDTAVLLIYDVMGRLIDRLNIDGHTQGTLRNVLWIPEAGAGVYFYTFDSMHGEKIGKIVLLNGK
jgi:outer membrane protein assembly factor BamB